MYALLRFLRKEVFFFCILAFLLFFSFYRLTEAPPTWYDEGMVIQLAINVARFGAFATQTAPGEFVSGALTSTGFPVVAPVAALFSIFGVDLWLARLVMVLYLLGFVVISHILVRKIFGKYYALLSSALLVTFASLYGNGKNVLGEVPGLFFLVSFLFLVYKIEAGQQAKRNFISAGLLAGLCLATKPTFLVLVPAAVIGAFLARFKISLKNFFYFFFAALVPLLVWGVTQFNSTDSFWVIFSFYSNPYRLTGIPGLILTNVVRFVTEGTPIHFFLLTLVWAGALLVRYRIGKGVSTAEAVGFVFVLGILSAYLRTPGWYRYFFPAELVAMIFFAPSLLFLGKWLEHIRKPSFGHALRGAYPRFEKYAVPLAGGLVVLLIIFQGYHLLFRSWVRSYYDSQSTAEAEEYFRSIDQSKTLFVYDAPAAVIFLQSSNYYQYIAVNAEGYWGIGKDKLSLIDQGVPDEIVLSGEFWEGNKELFPAYRQKDIVGRFAVLEKVLNQPK